MKKCLIALAILAAAGAVAAQSSVTLYGRAEFGTDHQQGKVTEFDGSGTTATKTRDSSAFGAEGIWGGNRIGLKGTEDLGGDLKLGFVYEMGVNADTVAAGTTFSGITRLANVSLTGGFGRVTIGTQMNGLDAIRGYSGSLSNYSSEWAKGKFGATNAFRIDGRSVNALSYAAKFGSVEAGIGAMYDTKKEVNAENGNYYLDTQRSGVIGMVRYAEGPLSVGLALGAGKMTTRHTTLDGKLTSNPKPDPKAKGAAVLFDLYGFTARVTDVALGGSYDFGIAKPWVLYQQVTTKRTLNGVVDPSFKVQNRAFEVGASAPLGTSGVTAWASVAMGKSTNQRVGWGEKQNGFELGAKYALSKRTSLNAAFNSSTVKMQQKNSAGVETSSKKTTNNRFVATVAHTF